MHETGGNPPFEKRKTWEAKRRCTHSTKSTGSCWPERQEHSLRREEQEEPASGKKTIRTESTPDGVSGIGVGEPCADSAVTVSKVEEQGKAVLRLMDLTACNRSCCGKRAVTTVQQASRQGTRTHPQILENHKKKKTSSLPNFSCVCHPVAKLRFLVLLSPKIHANQWPVPIVYLPDFNDH